MNLVRDARVCCALSKAGHSPVMGIYPWNSVTAIHPRWRRSPPRTSGAPKTPEHAALALQVRRHNFAIEALPKSENSQPYLYMCVRCKWTFRVNDRPGSVISIDQTGEALAEPENSGRAATFRVGPCPAFRGPVLRKRTIEIPRLGWFARLRYRIMCQVSAMWRRWTDEVVYGGGVDPKATTTIMAEDLLR